MWVDAKNKASQLSETKDIPEKATQEFRRFKMAAGYVDDLLRECNPKLLPLTIWDKFHNIAQNCFNSLQEYEVQRNVSILEQINGNIDQILSLVCPYTVNGKGAAQAAGRAFRQYEADVKKQLQTIKDETKALVDEIKNNAEESSDVFQRIEAFQKKIDQTEERLFSEDEENLGIEQKIGRLYDEITSLHEETLSHKKEIGDYYDELISKEDDDETIQSDIQQARDQVIEDSKTVNEKLVAVDNHISQLENFYTKIFGAKDDEGKREGGLKQEIDDSQKQMETFRKEAENGIEIFRQEQQTKYDALFEKIESLLPGATSAGLASAYKEQKDTFSAPVRFNTHLFYAALVILFVSSLVLVTDSIGINPFNVKFVDTSEISNLLHNLFSKLPVVLPALWLAIFASKRRSEAQRLQQEYAHKEAVTKSYESLRKQLKEMQAEDAALTSKLLAAAISTVEFNASTTLDGNHGEKIPFQEIIEKSVSAVTKEALSFVSTKKPV